jgi:hypothetical protein
MIDRPKRRIRFIECRVQDHGDRFEAKVSLVDGDKPIDVMVERPSGAGGGAWAAAEATVEAIRQAYAVEPDQVVLKDVVSLEMDGRPAIATSIVTTVGGERRSLFGLSGVVDGEGKAAALAVLGATNRFFRSG